MSEVALQSEIMRYLLQPGFHAIRVRLGGRGRRDSSGKKGTADIVGIGPCGRFFAIEVKTPTGVLSEEQTEFLTRMNRLGGYAIVARNMADVREMVRQMRCAERRSA